LTLRGREGPAIFFGIDGGPLGIEGGRGKSFKIITRRVKKSKRGYQEIGTGISSSYLRC